MITAFLILAEPDKLLYPYAESIRSLASVCDRIIINFAAGRTPGTRQFEQASFDKIVEITKEFPDCNFSVVLDESWPEQDVIQYEDLRVRFQSGLDMCSTGWFLRFDGDNVFFRSSAESIRSKLRACASSRHIVYFPRVDVVNRREFFVNSGSRDLYAINVDLLKRDGIDFRISLNKNEWCRVSFGDKINYEVIEDTSLMPVNYDATFFTRRRLIDFWKKTCVLYKNAGLIPSAVDSLEDDLVLDQYKHYIARKRFTTVRNRKHPEDMQERIENITPDCWGYDNFGGLR
jgi:hypothetical protein